MFAHKALRTFVGMVQNSTRLLQSYSTLSQNTSPRYCRLVNETCSSTHFVLPWNCMTRRGKRKVGKEPPVDIRAPKESITEFESMVYKAHFLWIPAAGSKMKLSGLYMQATIGPNNTEEPPRTDPLEHAHWVAWKQLGNMPKEQAEKEYIEMVKFFIKKAKTKPVIDAYGL